MERERSNKVEKGFASSVDGMRMIAKLSVLQADFKEFYDLLIMYPNAMELVLNANRVRTKIPKLPNDIKEYLKVYKIGEEAVIVSKLGPRFAVDNVLRVLKEENPQLPIRIEYMEQSKSVIRAIELSDYQVGNASGKIMKEIVDKRIK